MNGYISPRDINLFAIFIGLASNLMAGLKWDIMADKTKVRTKNRRYAPDDVNIPRKLGGGKLKELVIQDEHGKLVHYSLAYINPLIYAGDNGRVLGYDNSHGSPHKHYLGNITPEPHLSWQKIREKFENEWREIALAFVNEEELPT